MKYQKIQTIHIEQSNLKIMIVAIISMCALVSFNMVYAQQPASSAVVMTRTGFDTQVGTNGSAILKASSSVDSQTQATGVVNDRLNASGSMDVNATATMTHDEDAHQTSTTNGGETDSENTSHVQTSTDGQITAEAHERIVADFVHSLMQVAGHESGISAQVQTIAQTQNEAASSTVHAMAEVQQRNGFMNFMFGSDYHNLNVIRNQMATTTANMQSLQQLKDQTVNAQDRATLDMQIQSMQSEQAKVQAFVQAHENQFSLFGWFNAMFIS